MNPFLITPEGELAHSLYLIDSIIQDKWINNNTILVNCAPEYSSRVVQLANHKLSYLNNNELYEVLTLELPQKDMKQIWSSYETEYQMFDRYLKIWLDKYIVYNMQYLFITNSIETGRTLNKIKLSIKTDNCKFASVYLNRDSTFIPDYHSRQYSEDREGKLTLFWENTNKI